MICKTRLTIWGLSRQDKEHEIQAILLKRNEHAAGKKTAFELPESPLDVAGIQRYASAVVWDF